MTDTVGVAFYVLAAAILIASLGVVLARNMVHSALCLAATLLFVAGLYLNLQADLLAGFQVLIYVGAVITLILIAIMLIQHIGDGAVMQTNQRWGVGALVSAALAAVMIWIFSDTIWPTTSRTVDYPSQLRDLYLALFDRYVVPFEVAGVLLLVALVGAIVIAQQTEHDERGA